jgi:hypothetical protein
VGITPTMAEINTKEDAREIKAEYLRKIKELKDV